MSDGRFFLMLSGKVRKVSFLFVEAFRILHPEYANSLTGLTGIQMFLTEVLDTRPVVE